MKKALPPLHLVCGNGETEQATQFVEVRNGIATALNGTLLAQMNLAHYSSMDDETLHKLEGKKIHRDIWEQVQEATALDVTGDTLHYERGGVRADVDISCPFTFPDYSATVNTIIAAQYDGRFFIALAPEWIALAKKLFGDVTLIVRAYQAHEMLIIFPKGKGQPRAFLAFTPEQIAADDAVIDWIFS